MTEAKQNILLVDDDEEDFMIIRDMFADFPQQTFHLEWISDYGEAKKAIEKNEHALYLIDNQLGVNSGLDLIGEARPKAAAPFILLTGQGDLDVDIEAMKRGAEDFLVKSQLSAPLLERSMRYAINRKASENSIRRLYEERLQMEAQILQQDRLASIGLLASSLAHEIGTPLGVMRGRSEMIIADSGSPSAKKNAEIVLAQIDRVSKLIRSLLNLARGDQSKTVVSVNVKDVISDVIDLIGPEMKKNNIACVLEVGSDVSVMAESGPLHQVLLNLLVNSIHAIQSAIASGRTSDHRIRITAALESRGWRVSVADTGCGISKENKRMLFKPFFTTKEIGKGTGLGLATTLRLVEGWGGSIDVVSEVNAGTTLNIFLRGS